MKLQKTIVGECPATIGFRVDADSGKALAERSKALGVSVHELARHYVMLVLHEAEDRENAANAILAMRQELLELRKDIAVSTEALLTSAGNVSAPAARDWTRKNLKVQ